MAMGSNGVTAIEELGALPAVGVGHRHRHLFAAAQIAQGDNARRHLIGADQHGPHAPFKVGVTPPCQAMVERLQAQPLGRDHPLSLAVDGAEATVDSLHHDGVCGRLAGHHHRPIGVGDDLQIGGDDARSGVGVGGVQHGEDRPPRARRSGRAASRSTRPTAST